jgi:hypothetical protein
MSVSYYALLQRSALGAAIGFSCFMMMNTDLMGQEGANGLALISEVTETTDLGTTHKVYAENTELADGFRVISVFGGGAANGTAENAQLSAETTSNFFQHEHGGLSADQVVEELFGSFPDLAYDSWFTIGDALGNANALGQAGSPNWGVAADVFEAGGDFLVNDEFGGAFYLLPGAAAQGQSVDGRVLVGQFTSTGEVQIQANLQWRPNGADAALQTFGLAVTLTPEVPGCTDEGALNFNGEAEWDDGSCEFEVYSDVALVWEEVLLAEENAGPDGTRTYRVWAQLESEDDTLIAVFGTVMQPVFIGASEVFFQHDNGATLAPDVDGTLLGLMPDLAADSWLAIASAAGDSGPTNVLTSGLSLASFESGGALESDPAFGGSWFVLPSEVPPAVADDLGRVLIAQLTTAGQVEFNACLNYRTAEGPTEALGLSVTFPDEDQALGCVDSDACNYDAEAAAGGWCEYLDALDVCGGPCLGDADDDGVCDSDEVSGCMDVSYDNFDAAATDDDGSCTNAALGVQLESLVYEWVAGATSGTSDPGIAGHNTYRVYAQFDGPGASVTSIFGNDAHPFLLSCEGQFYQAPDGGPFANAAAHDSWWAISTAAEPAAPSSIGIDFEAFESGGSLQVDAPLGGAIFVVPGDQPAAISGTDGRVLLGQFTSNAPSSLTLSLHYLTASAPSQDAFDLSLDFPSVWSGCADALACNFNAADAESCIYALPNMDCGGICLNDVDNDGICDENEISGCTYTSACNYDAAATDENGTCTFAAPHLDCNGDCLVDANENSICDHSETWGCTYTEAANFNASATIDDGSCELANCIPLSETCAADIDESGYVSMPDLLIFLAVYENWCE